MVWERQRLARVIAEETVGATARRRAVRQLQQLETELGAAPPDLTAQLSYEIAGHWLRPREEPKTEVLTTDIHYGWHPGQARGFRAFRDIALDPNPSDYEDEADDD